MNLFFTRIRRKRRQGLRGFAHALLHEGVLRRTGELLAVRADRLDLTGDLDVGLAFLDERRFGGTGQRLAILAEGLGLAAGQSLRKRRSGKEGEHERGNQLHGE